jgi:hypothetical protein
MSAPFLEEGTAFARLEGARLKQAVKAPTGRDLPHHQPNPKPPQRHGPPAVGGSPLTREQLFLSQLALIERVIAWVCVRRCLRGADAEDFSSTVKLRFIENDYEILGRFEGRSSLKTYVAVVINRLYLDYQTKRLAEPGRRTRVHNSGSYIR